MQSGKAPPALGVKRSSRRSAAAPYSKESSESNNSTGLTGMLKDKSAIESWDEDKPASVSAAARGGSSKQRGMTKMASGAAGFMRSVTMKASGKMKVCEMKVSGRFAAPAPPEMVQCTLERDAKGAFGLGLNDHNRITEVAPGSSAEKAGLQVFDRVLKLNGKELKGPLMHSIGKSDSLALSIERPPKSLHDKITAKERQPDSSPRSSRRRRRRRRRSTTWKSRPIWPASAAQAADWPRLAGARGSLRHDLALRGASGEPAGRGLSPLVLHIGGGAGDGRQHDGRQQDVQVLGGGGPADGRRPLGRPQQHAITQRLAGRTVPTAARTAPHARGQGKMRVPSVRNDTGVFVRGRYNTETSDYSSVVPPARSTGEVLPTASTRASAMARALPLLAALLSCASALQPVLRFRDPKTRGEVLLVGSNPNPDPDPT
eukprot:scaffold29854_cov57-Phaeocystis_antarctica.AAC.4